MKIQYQFTNEVIEVEVSEEWATIVLDLDRQEYNVNHRETRRHCSFETYSIEGNEVADDVNIVDEVLRNTDHKSLYKALSTLEPRQRYLIEEHFFKGRTQTEIAEEEGVSLAAVHQSINRAIKKIKKILI